MRLNFAAARRRRPTMTPLIDIIFLLLLFFMLSSTFSKFGEIELVGANTAGAADATKPPVYLRLKGDEIAVNGVPVLLDELGAALSEQTEAGTRLALLSMDEETTSQRFIDVYAVTRGVSGLGVAIVR